MDEPDPAHPATPRDDGDRVMFVTLNEIAIIAQLARTRFERVMPDGLLLPHFSVLNHLVRLGDGRSLKTIASAFEVSRGTMTNTVQRLERRGLVAVLPDRSDRRVKRVHLTDAGRTMHAAAIVRLAPDFARLGADPGRAEFATVVPHLQRIRRALDAMRDAAPSGGGEG